MLTTEEVARHLSFKPATIRARIKDGELKARRVGRVYRVEWPDVWACERGSYPCESRQTRDRMPLMTKAELAGWMRVSERTIERWIADGLPTRTVFSAVRINRIDAAAWLRSRFGIDVDLDDNRPAL